MLSYQHYSFDLWLTLIRSNPLFKRERARYFHQRLNPSGKSLAEVEAVFRSVDLMCNAINEKTGGNIEAEEMYLMVVSLINGSSEAIAYIDVHALYADMEALLFEHLPLIYCADTMPVLDRIRERDDVSLNILSNTGFIKGSTLRKVLARLGLDAYFDFQLYSDESGMSKPKREFFLRMISEACAYRKATIQPGQILHIGDNPVADGEGARSAGMCCHLIHSNQQSILTLIA